MNKRNLRTWELRLGLLQVVILLGIVTGSMACVFYLGFLSGHRIGFDGAMDAALASSPRIPINGLTGEENEMTDEAQSRIFAKLNEDQSGAKATTPEEMPELGAIAESGAPNEQTAPSAGAPIESAAVEDSSPAAVLGTGADINVLGTKDRPQEGSVTLQDTHQQATGASVADGPPIETATSTNEVPKDSPVKESQAAAVVVAKQGKSEVIKAKGTVASHGQPEAEPPAPTKVAALPKPPVTAGRQTSSPKVPVAGPVKPGWYAQIAAPKSRSDAEGLVEKLRGSGFATAVEVAQVRGAEYFRVLVGPEANREQAERLLGQLKREKYLSGDPFIRLVR